MSENTTPVEALCKRYGLNQTELARRFDIPYRTVQDWYSGRRKAPDYVVGMMEQLLSLERMAGKE